MSHAVAIPNVYIPAASQKIDGEYWLMFCNEGTFQAFKAMPNGLMYEGRLYGKRGWNSDTRTVHYKEIPLAVAV